MAEPSFSEIKNKYRRMWDGIRLTRKPSADERAKVILRNKQRYVAVERETGVPWYFIAVTHMRESSNNFAGVLHNGQHIIGTGKKTTLVPKGRGPFDSWEEAAIDAIKLKGLQKIADWPIERVLYECERFNGWGYHWKGQPSPYVWAGTTFYKAGKYVADGQYDPDHVDAQLGVACVLKRLEGMGVEVDGEREKPEPAPQPDDPGPEPEPDVVPVPVKQGWFRSWGARLKAGFAAIGFTGFGFLTDWQMAAAFFVFVLILIGIAIAILAWLFDAAEVRAWLRKQVS